MILNLFMPNDHLIRLGTGAVAEIKKHLPEFTPVMEITEDLIMRFYVTETHEVGYTEEFKDGLIESLRNEVGKLMLVSQDFMPTPAQCHYNFLMVKYLNLGLKPEVLTEITKMLGRARILTQESLEDAFMMLLELKDSVLVRDNLQAVCNTLIANQPKVHKSLLNVERLHQN